MQRAPRLARYALALLGFAVMLTACGKSPSPPAAGGSTASAPAPSAKATPNANTGAPAGDTKTPITLHDTLTSDNPTERAWIDAARELTWSAPKDAKPHGGGYAFKPDCTLGYNLRAATLQRFTSGPGAEKGDVLPVTEMTGVVTFEPEKDNPSQRRVRFKNVTLRQGIAPGLRGTPRTNPPVPFVRVGLREDGGALMPSGKVSDTFWGALGSLPGVHIGWPDLPTGANAAWTKAASMTPALTVEAPMARSAIVVAGKPFDVLTSSFEQTTPIGENPNGFEGTRAERVEMRTTLSADGVVLHSAVGSRVDLKLSKDGAPVESQRIHTLLELRFIGGCGVEPGALAPSYNPDNDAEALLASYGAWREALDAGDRARTLAAIDPAILEKHSPDAVWGALSNLQTTHGVFVFGLTSFNPGMAAIANGPTRYALTARPAKDAPSTEQGQTLVWLSAPDGNTLRIHGIAIASKVDQLTKAAPSPELIAPGSPGEQAADLFVLTPTTLRGSSSTAVNPTP